MKRTVTLLLVLAACGIATAAQDPSAAGGSLPAPIGDADFYEQGKPPEAKVTLGRMLFFDKILSGNKNIACATCHHPTHASGDGLALPLGEGPRGLGPERRSGDSLEESVHERVPRNSPALFNLGAREFERLFHDGRVETDPQGFYEGGFITPAKWKLPPGLDNVLAAQAMFPVTSHAEMAGQQGENAVADARARNKVAGPGGVWELLARRLQGIPEYVNLFRRAFPEQVRRADDITFVMAANALAAFETVAFRADNSPFDQYLRGEENRLSEAAKRGMALFYGAAGCSSCHAGKFQTDHAFHAIAMPQIGPGKADGSHADYWEATGHQAVLEDHGRGRVTVRTEDAFKFRTPSLRNVALTGPWGHAGAYDRLEAVIRHHLDPVQAVHSYVARSDLLPPLGAVAEITVEGSKLAQAFLSPDRQTGFVRRDTWVQRQPALRHRIAAANELAPKALSDAQIADVLAFLSSLTDPRAANMAHLIPARVPSGLSVVD